MRVDVVATRPQPTILALRYLVAGRTSELRLPPKAAPARADELWRRTCFEAFLRTPPDPAYAELNFSPSTEWAAYRFDRYREGMSLAREIAVARIDVQTTSQLLTLETELSVGGVPADAAWRLGLSAVIEEASGRISYWALAHPPGKPDFHHSDCFALELVPASQV